MLVYCTSTTAHVNIKFLNLNLPEIYSKKTFVLRLAIARSTYIRIYNYLQMAAVSVIYVVYIIYDSLTLRFFI